MMGTTDEIPVREYGVFCDGFRHETSHAIHDCTVLVPMRYVAARLILDIPNSSTTSRIIRPAVSDNLGKSYG